MVQILFRIRLIYPSLLSLLRYNNMYKKIDPKIIAKLWLSLENTDLTPEEKAIKIAKQMGIGPFSTVLLAKASDLSQKVESEANIAFSQLIQKDKAKKSNK